MTQTSKSQKNIIIIGIALVVVAAAVVVYLLFGKSIGGGDSRISFDFQQAATVGDTIVFTNESPALMDDDLWEWDFGDESPIKRSRDAFHVYQGTGNFTVTLTYRDEPAEVKKGIVVISPPKPPKAYFELAKETWEVGEKLEIINKSENAWDLVWTFDK
jgi:PKD repeat protein